MSDAADKGRPKTPPRPFHELQEGDIARLRDLAEATRFVGVGGVPARLYFGQGYVEVPSAWLATIIDRLLAAEARAGVCP